MVLRKWEMECCVSAWQNHNKWKKIPSKWHWWMQNIGDRTNRLSTQINGSSSEAMEESIPIGRLFVLALAKKVRQRQSLKWLHCMNLFTMWRDVSTDKNSILTAHSSVHYRKIIGRTQRTWQSTNTLGCIRHYSDTRSACFHRLGWFFCLLIPIHPIIRTILNDNCMIATIRIVLYILHKVIEINSWALLWNCHS